jgi:hypothetical protein
VTTGSQVVFVWSGFGDLWFRNPLNALPYSHAHSLTFFLRAGFPLTFNVRVTVRHQSAWMPFPRSSKAHKSSEPRSTRTAHATSTWDCRFGLSWYFSEPSDPSVDVRLCHRCQPRSDILKITRPNHILGLDEEEFPNTPEST